MSSTKKPFDEAAADSEPDDAEWQDRRQRVMGLGERSFQKSYYPELQRRLNDLGDAHTALQDQVSFVRQLIETIPSPVFFKDAAFRYLGCNRAFEAYLGIPRERIEGATAADIAPPDLARVYEEADARMLAGEYLQTYEAKVRFADGSQHDVLFNKAVFFGSDGVPAGIVGVMQDISQLKDTQARLEYLAHHDSLTGLPNRTLLADRLQQAMLLAERRHSTVAVVYLDLDNFKAINDARGHSAGDRLLVELSERMKQALREGDTLARLGGDEFVAVLLDLGGREASQPILDRLREATALPVEVDGLALTVSASIGVSFFPQADDITADQLMRQADQAMYHAKQSGKGRCHLFDADHDRALRDRHDSIERIREALKNAHLVLHYQPKVNMRSGEVVGFEALIRWQDPQRGLVAPGQFLPLIEDHELIVEVGDWVIETALQQMDAWRLAGLHFPVSVNIASRQLQAPDFLDKLKQALAGHPDVAGQLELEVLESSALDDMGQASLVMRACRNLGVGFSLDDFGTGYSSLTYLKRLPAQGLKIDQSFVRDMLDDADDLAILDGIIGLAEAFQRRVVAEGVETDAHSEMLLRLGCDLGQGYAIAKPMPAAEVAGWVERQRTTAASHRQCSRIDRADMPVLSLMAEHRAWVKALASYLQDKRLAPPPLDSRQCRFGKWLEEVSARHDANGELMRRIVVIHEAIHRRAQELHVCKLGGDSACALAGLAEVDGMRDELLELLLQLIGQGPRVGRFRHCA